MTAVQLAPGAYRIPLTPLDMVNAFAFAHDDGQVTLVDTGVASSGPRVLAGLASAGLAPEQVTRIVLTHAHPDHLGGLADVRAGSPRARVAIHGSDAPFARAGQSPPRDPASRLGAFLARRSPEREWAPAAVEEELRDGEAIAGTGLVVHHTPGHTPGHIALLHEPTGVLVTGDTIFHLPWGMRWSFAAFCSDFRLSQRTAHVLGELEYEVAAFTHGPEVRERARERVRGFLARKRALDASR